MIPSSEPNQLSQEFWQALRRKASLRKLAKGEALFFEGSPAAEIYLVETGEVRLLISNGRSQMRMLELAGTGAIFGLSEVLSGEQYRMAAVANAETTVSVIARQRLQDLLRDNGDFCMEIVRMLSDNLHALYHKFRNITSHPGRPRQAS